MRTRIGHNRQMDSLPCMSEAHQNEVHPDERDPEVLRAALNREHAERRRAECLAKMQAGVVQLALDLLVREPDLESFFGALTQALGEGGEGLSGGRWLGHGA